jgi:DNA-directed RNA polymerase subunit M/transcription elongation factor TFIIS
MKFCNQCRNALVKIESNNGLVWYCNSCSCDFKIEPKDMIIYGNEQKQIIILKEGSVIYNYATNPKIEYKCKKAGCPYTIIAYELDVNGNKMYGCRCNHSWIEYKKINTNYF